MIRNSVLTRLARASAFPILIAGLLGCSQSTRDAADATLKATGRRSEPVGHAPADVDTFLAAFHEDPVRILNSLPSRRDESGQPILTGLRAHVRSDRERELILTEMRRQICLRAGGECDTTENVQEALASFGDRDDIQRFVTTPGPAVRSLREMEEKKLTRHTLKRSPWSDSFWPLTRGGIGRRYADPGFPGTKDWIRNFNYIQGRPAWSIADNMRAPSEKYDALVGDGTWSLTDRNWSKGRRYIDKYGAVPGWVGICHGWAPAAIAFDRPLKAVDVPTANGDSVTFYPSDIKALASSIWGEAPPIMAFLGRRCKKNSPDEDEIGRVTDETCFDVNPGSLHMALVNQLGVMQRGFVIDSTWDFEVWNYPLYAYHYHYFNPQTLKVSNRLAGSSVDVRDYTIDKFKKYRNPMATSVVGIVMDVTYAVPIQPTRRVIERDKYHTVRYVYDLELDRSGTIIGGEWYSNFHPDFLWNPKPTDRALSTIEKRLATELVWDGTKPVSKEIQEAAQKSSRSNEPLAVIVERLIQMATEGAEPPMPRDDIPEPEGEGTPGSGDDSDGGLA